MKKAEIVVIGGSAAGLTAAITARRHYPEKRTLLVRREKQVLIPCGIPYIFGTVDSPGNDLIPDAVLDKNGIELLLADVTRLDRLQKMLETSEGDVSYDRLVLPPGSLPARPPIDGTELDGVFSIHKDADYLEELQKRLASARDVVVIGGGFIGIELADEINKAGDKNVTVIEIASHCLSLAYDEEFCVKMEERVRSRGVTVRTSTRVDRLEGEDTVESVVLNDGTAVKADVVILGVGAAPNVGLAEAAGLQIGVQTGAIMVDRTLRTSDENIYACGDCAKKISFFGGQPSHLRLASIATSEARIAAANLFGIKRENIGTIGVWSTAVDGLALGTAGLTEDMARQRGYQVVAATVEGPNRHPGKMPGACDTVMKLVFERNSGVILGGQVMGDTTAGEIINALSACIQTRMTAEDIAIFQTGTHPALTASPIAYPLVNAAEMALGRMASS